MRASLAILVLLTACSSSSSLVADGATGCAAGCDAASDDATVAADAPPASAVDAPLDADAAVDAPAAPKFDGPDDRPVVRTDAPEFLDAFWTPADTGVPADATLGRYDGAGPFPDFAACQRLGFSSVDEVSTKFVVPRCGGTNSCHQLIFPPRHLDMAAMFRAILVDQPSQVLCKTDRYIDRTDVTKSFMLAKVWALTENVPCPSGGAANSGGTRMPNSMPGVAGPRLSDDELGCYTWWVYELAK